MSFRHDNIRQLNPDSKPASGAQAPDPPQSQPPNRPLFSYDNPRQSTPSKNQSRPARTARPPPPGAIDLRSFNAQPSSSPSQSTNRPTQRPLIRQPSANPNRSTGAFSGSRKPGANDTARRSPSTTTRARTRQSRPATPSKPDIYGSKAEDDKMTEEEEAYEREKEEAQRPKEQTYVPAAVTLESLSGMGPGLPVVGMGVGAWGQEEAVNEWVQGVGRKRRIRRAERLKSADDVEDVDKDQKGKETGAEGELKETGTAEERKETEAEGEEEKVAETLRKVFDAKKIAEKMFSGEYVFDGREDKGVLGSLRRQAVRNGSYYPKDGEFLAEKVRSLLPVEYSRGDGKAAKV